MYTDAPVIVWEDEAGIRSIGLLATQGMTAADALARRSRPG
jgi:hypothetical protein